MTLAEAVKWVTYKPHGPYERIDERRCRAKVHERGRGVGFYQCCRMPKAELAGVGLCRQHAARVQSFVTVSNPKAHR